MPPSLGVLITYYNEGPLLTECLDTLLSGLDKPDEILVYDDASQDPAERYVRDHHPVRIIRGNENIGIGRARNELMKASQSDFIHFQDADDFFDPEWCQKVRERIGDGDVDIVFNNVSLVDIHTQNEQAERFSWLSGLEESGDLVLFFLVKATPLWVAMLTFRRRHGLEAGGYPPREVIDVVEDREFHMRLFARGLKHRVVDEPLVLKLKRPNSLSCDHEAKVRREIHVAHVKVWGMLLDWLPVHYHPRAAINLLRDNILLYPLGEIELARQAVRRFGSLGIENGGARLAADRPLLAQLLFQNGVFLFRAGQIHDARAAFRLAERFGPIDHRAQSGGYRTLLKMFGPEFAERSAFFYGRVVPAGVRARIRGFLVRRK
ncbi:MAG: glycosyltransferase family 2 protein [Candidatus Omnitrophota bacterium]